eukprot:gnl/Dysnectes_brevis/16447_a40761_73.p1 GENE.gnl/Dysnectes_brevis/16447_a40761_73~~gnl/Dysnectes_brevis/16447_a40761_73.p1  ORF type:complete len:129 (+),score=30.02 gnl/Dysnectes_brevis/16447_a40761_73:222-608(+)
MGECQTDFGVSKGCFFTGNHTCECTQCGWGTSSMRSCSGTCDQSHDCGQARKGGSCGCVSTDCHYDWALRECSGYCSATTNCLQTERNECKCVACGYDYNIGGCYGSCSHGDCVLYGNMEECHCESWY